MAIAFARRDSFFMRRSILAPQGVKRDKAPPESRFL